ncbi:ATP-binding protein [Methanolobus sediminis]|uniref:histidine kinase n=1 Tax=Methanolobus sediminis TaxID=3072978 RepID=A0AA51UI15_9EURY|nr:ATP-binding protein [Methanolobus sediminis]WMW23887.1 ATP-binding protein [Methanolobus sediminis]
MSALERAFLSTKHIIVFSFFFGILSWIIDGLLDTTFFSERTFVDSLIFGLSTHEIYMRISMFFIILIFGMIVSLFVHRMQEMNNVIENEKIKSHKIMDILPMIILFLDTEGNVSCVNKKILELTGYEEVRISGNKWLDLLFPEEYRSEVLPYWDKFVSGEIDSVTGLEFPIICADGSRKHVLWNAVSFIDDNGRFAGITISGEDITDRKIAEKALLMDESRLEALIELSQYSDSTIEEILDFSLEKAVNLTESSVGYVGFVNEAEETFSMYSWSEITEAGYEIKTVNMDCNIDVDNLWGIIVKQRKPLISNNYPDDSPIKKGSPAGHVNIRNYLCIPISDSGNIVMIASVGNKNGNYDSSDIRQITLLMEGTWKIIQRRENEEQIKSYAREVAEYNKELESLDRMKDEFMANITHELKTPLIPIKGYSELLFEGHLGSLDEDQKKGIGVILQNADRLHKLIDSLLYMQNIHSGNIQYHLDSVDIVNVLDNVIDKVLTFKDKGPELKTEYSSPLPFICGNSTYLKQVFSHILENALKFTPPDGLITVVASHEDKNIRIIVRDTGIGISKDEMPHIFKRFYQVDGSLTRRYGGNGLGLYLCKSVVEAHGGSIYAVSEVGKGTEIHVLLPIIEE